MLGPIGNKVEGSPVGLLLHNSHAFTPDGGVPLGVVSAACWARDPQSPRLLVQANRRRQRQVMSDERPPPLWEHMGGLEVAGRPALHLPRRGPSSWTCGLGR